MRDVGVRIVHQGRTTPTRVTFEAEQTRDPTMCYSAEVWASFDRYRAIGGVLAIKEFVKLAGWTQKKGVWIRTLPQALRRALLGTQREYGDEVFKAFAAAEISGIDDLTEDLQKQEDRLARAKEILASHKPTKAAEKERAAAEKKIKAGLRKLDDLKREPPADGTGRIWPGHFCPVLIRDPESGERLIVPMRYRCRLPGWTEQDERLKPGTYNARRDKLSTVWRRLFGYTHGIVGATHFFESVSLHRLQQRDLTPGEKDVSVEIEFAPEPAQDLYLACLWRYIEDTPEQPGFYTFAIITRDPPQEVQAAGHDRCVIAIRKENVQAWLNPDPHHLQAMYDILDNPVDAYYTHELLRKDDDEAQ